MAWYKYVESAGNRLLALDPELLEQLAPYYGKTFRIEIIEPSYSIDLRPCPDGFILEAADENEADVSLRGSLWAFMQLAREGAHSDVFDQGRITMAGDAELGQSFQRILSSLEIDWEELTSKFVGDMAARNIHRVFDEFRNWFSESSENFKQNTGEIIQQELKLAPAKIEVDAMTDEIETLRADVARLEARIARLQSAIAQSDENPDA